MLGQKIIKPLSIDFSIDTFGLYAISITARCQSGKLLGLWGGENLRVEIDDVWFREIPLEKKIQMFDIPPAWNGTVLQSQGIHYIELWADRTPTLHSVTPNLGEFTLKPPQRIPTVDDPMWTGDFADDTNQMILARALFGEARSTLVPDEARIAISWVVRNRVESKEWSDSYYEVITEPVQFSAFNRTDPNRPFVENPLHTKKDIDREAWEHSHDIAEKIINGELSDPTEGANHYYDDSISTPDWAQDEKATLEITYVNASGEESTIYFYNL